MNTIKLAGVDVPRVGLGTNRLTRDHVGFIRDAVDAGLRHIDTAHLYTDGESERTIGEALPGGRDDMVIATKGGFRGAATLRDEIEQSLRSLRTDHIDLYYLHRPHDLEASLETIAADDRIRAVGISAVSIEEIERARAVVEIAAVQNEYNESERGCDDVVDYCEREGIVFVPYYPLRGGTLRWLLDRSPVIAPIPGTLSLEHLRENLAVA